MDDQHAREVAEARKTVDDMIIEAEKSKAEIYRPKGKEIEVDNDDNDDDFDTVSAHVDPTLIPKIERGKYVDLAKLLHREKLLHNSGGRMKREGQSFLCLLQRKSLSLLIH